VGKQRGCHGASYGNRVKNFECRFRNRAP
jgi:hypothetical protein